MKEVFRDPLTLLLGVAMPVLLLFLFSSLKDLGGGIDLFNPQFLTPGIVIFSMSFIIMFTGTLLGKDAKTALLTRLLSTPLNPMDYFFAYLLPFLPVALFQVLVCYGVGVVLGMSLVNVGLSLLVFFMMALICISIGIIMGSLLSLNQISGVGSLLITVVSLFSGAWMDLKMIGGVFKGVGYVMPFAHSVDALKTLSKGGNLTEIQTNLIWISAYVLVFFVLAVLSIKRRTRRK